MKRRFGAFKCDRPRPGIATTQPRTRVCSRTTETLSTWLGGGGKGQAEIEAKLKQAFTFVFAESRLTVTEVSVKFLSPDIAVAHVSWSMMGAIFSNIPEPRWACGAVEQGVSGLPRQGGEDQARVVLVVPS